MASVQYMEGPRKNNKGPRRPAPQRRSASQLAEAGFQLHADFVRTGKLSDLDSAINLLEMAVDEQRFGRRTRAIYANKLGVALHDKYKLVGSDIDLDEAIRWLRKSATAFPKNHPARARLLSDLATAVQALGVRSRVEADVQEAIELWRQASAVTTAPAYVRLGAARSWGSLAANTGGPAEGLDGLTAAVKLLPDAAWWGFDRGTRQQLLTNCSGLATDAAACAIAAGQPKHALELLDWGRGVLWSQLLKTRTDRTVLHEVDPQLAQRMDKIASELERDEGLETNQRIKLVHAWEKASRKESRRLREWNKLKEQANETLKGQRGSITLPGSAFEMPTFEILSDAAKEGPVVVINVSQWRCDALITKQTRVLQIVELPELTRDDVHTQAERYLTALTKYKGTKRSEAISQTLDWLWRVIAQPVLSALDYQEPVTDPQSTSWPHLWWCPTGPLTILPLHAAAHRGRYDSTNGAAVIDRVISSYTPTMLSLIRARNTLRARETTTHDQDTDREDRRLLHVTVSHSPDLGNLPGVAHSRTCMEQLFPTARRTTLDGSDATRESVAAELARHTWVHFDCHGTQDLDNPFRSGLVLHDQTLTVANLAGVRCDHAEFAFLAACDTAVGGIRIPDEVITLTTALQYAGYPYVIGTLWSIQDRSAVRITQSVYSNLAHDGQLWPSDSAWALHNAIRAERIKYPHNPRIWAPFLHIGP